MYPDHYRGVVRIEREVIPIIKFLEHGLTPIVDPFKLSVLRIKKFHSKAAVCEE